MGPAIMDEHRFSARGTAIHALRKGFVPAPAEWAADLEGHSRSGNPVSTETSDPSTCRVGTAPDAATDKRRAARAVRQAVKAAREASVRERLKETLGAREASALVRALADGSIPLEHAVEWYSVRGLRKASSRMVPGQVRIVQNSRKRSPDDAALVTMRIDTFRRIVAAAAPEPDLASAFAPRPGMPAAKLFDYEPPTGGTMPDIDL